MNKDRPTGSVFQYAAMASQWIIVLVTTVYFGKWLDEKWAFKKAFLIWLLPLLSLAGLMLKLIRDTSKK
ncbi:hypothetical protein [Sediminibacterium goheungense]|uniref:Uncharacterized protein n=1 Tax=Sediminibacterium goheungense TaxID=1086393 RepID=A0A4R6IZK9_9BACT|nr:hypothetical protein [Sediminibacterium goheungense]TDO28339.1 hypothetical protein BC659_0402 [Sediminibacterium goheungense]